MNPVAQIRRLHHDSLSYDAIVFVCPGCKEMWDGGTGFHMLPVTQPDNAPLPFTKWDWDGNLEAPTLSPSILTRHGGENPGVCHSFLKAGVWEFLSDCTHSLAGQRVPMVPLEDWMVKD